VKTAKPYRMFDGYGLYLEMYPGGGKLWRFKFKINGKEDRHTLGAYPEVSLADARDRRVECRKLVAKELALT